MNPFTCYRLHITPLSPIHIGTGESYQPTHYVIEDGVLHEFDTGAAMAALSGADREALLRIASGKPDADLLKAVQRFFFERRDALKPWAVNRIPVLPGVANLYAQRVGQTANRESHGGQVANRLEIDRAAHNPITRQPVLYGSSLKGALRTALLDRVNNEKPLNESDAELFQLGGLPDYEKRKRERSQGEVFKRLNQKLFKGSFELDPLRLVQLADAVWLGESDLPATQVSFAVNRYKKDARDKHGNALNPKTDKGPDQLLECVSSWRYRAFSAQLNLHPLDNLPNTDRKGQRQLPVDDLRFDVAQIAEACNAFYWPILLTECETMRQRGYLDPAWDHSAQMLLATARAKLDRGEAFLLRAGRHSGAESVTLNGVRHIKILLEGKDPQTRKQRFSFADAAKTLWLAAEHKDQRQNLLPFGWLLVEIEPWEQPTRDWPELKALCEPHLSAARAFAARLESQRDAMAKTRAAAEQQRRAEEEQAWQKAQAEAEAARQAAERQAQLATLSEEARQVEAFRERMEREGAQEWAKTGNGGGWFSDLKKLAQSAAAWLPDDKEALLAVLRELGQRDPRLSPKKNDGIKKLIKSLSA